MGLPEAKAAWVALKAEINALPDSYEKADLVKLGAEKLSEMARGLRSFKPSNLSEVSDDIIKVLINDAWYDLDVSTGELTPR